MDLKDGKSSPNTTSEVVLPHPDLFVLETPLETAAVRNLAIEIALPTSPAMSSPTTGDLTSPLLSPPTPLPLRPDWAINQTSNTDHPFVIFSPPRTLRIAYSTTFGFGPEVLPQNLRINVFARYCCDSRRLWIGVQKFEYEGCGWIKELVWMIWKDYTVVEYAIKPWMRTNGQEFCRMGKLSAMAIRNAWLKVDECDRREDGDKRFELGYEFVTYY